MGRAFYECLMNNRSLRTICNLSSPDRAPNIAFIWFQYICGALNEIVGIERLRFSNIKDDWRSSPGIRLDVASTWKHLPESVQDSDGVSSTATQESQNSRLIFTIRIVNNPLKGFDWENRIQQHLPGRARLTSMILRIYGSEVEYTHEILEFLKTTVGLERLECDGYKLDLVPICHELRTNTNLLTFDTGQTTFTLSDTMELVRVGVEFSDTLKSVCLEMLQEDNVTLRRFEPVGKADPRIQYYLDLNRLGRARVRENTSNQNNGKLLVDLLLVLWEDVGLQEIKSLHAKRCQSVAYGLLREAPGTWCQL